MSLVQHWPNDPCIPKCNEECHRVERAGQPPPDPQVPEAGLDVERLAMAISVVGLTMESARQIAAEYNRLAGSVDP